MKQNISKAISAFGSVKKLNKEIENFNRGGILCCPRCEKVDIHPINHFDKCNPEEEAQRQYNMDYYN